MAVVINEFEVAVPPDQPTQGAPPPASPTPATQPGAREVEQIMRCQMERFERLRAH
jgi:hypothetical protein